MNRTRQLFESLAILLSYPKGEIGVVAGQAIAALEGECPEIADRLQEFALTIGRLPLSEREELFTRTFDINPLCCQEVGWQIFGECYDRGGFLVEMRGLLRDRGVTESGELPDHLTHLLALFPRLDDAEAWKLGKDRMVPAIEKMLEGFKDDVNPYRDLLDVVRIVTLKTHLPEGAEHEEADHVR
ncbi:MAG: hypothetical protein KDB18_05955 [Salinibacterium sp.]|nr:hypothetical protein [Planctomycetota bacterium]MCB1281049.1 hypothetical protein [Salinibacterium sp.]